MKISPGIARTALAAAFLFAGIGTAVSAQAPDPAEINLHPATEIAQKEQDLIHEALASPAGEAGAILHRQDGHWLLLMARTRTGESEVHEFWTDEILVRSGSLDLVVGGTLTGKRSFNNLHGEFHGSGLDGGTVYKLAAGDVIRVPAGVPHWMKITSTEPAVFLITKVK